MTRRRMGIRWFKNEVWQALAEFKVLGWFEESRGHIVKHMIKRVLKMNTDYVMRSWLTQSEVVPQ